MAEEPAVDFGSFLRQAREKRGISLQQVSATTKISARVLEALERNDPSKLPGGIFSRAFVRSYAREVGLDPEGTVEQFIEAFPALASADEMPAITTSDDAENFESRRKAATTIVQLVGVSLIVVVIVVIYYSMRPKTEPPAPVKVVSESVQEPKPPVAPPAAAPASADPQASASQTATPGGAPAGTPATAGTLVPPANSPAGTNPPAAPAQAPATDAPLTIEVAASAACWLVLTVDGSRVVARTLEPGEHVSYPVRSFVTINAGNAGALALTLNGKAARPIGTAGQVVTATITPGNVATFLQQP